MPTVANVLIQYAHTSAFLWQRRRDAVRAPHYRLVDLVKLDRRIDAQLDGLRIAGDDGWDVCEEQLRNRQAADVFACGILAFESCDPRWLECVESVVRSDPTLVGALASALGWLENHQAAPHWRRLAGARDVTLRQVGITAAALHRAHPGPSLELGLLSDEPQLRARSYRAVGQLNDRSLSSRLATGFAERDDACRFWAAWSGGMVGMGGASDVLCEIAESDSIFSQAAADLAVRLLTLTDAQSWQRRISADLRHVRTAIVAARALGDVTTIPWLLSAMEDPRCARIAAEALTHLTGVDLVEHELDRPPPEDFTSGPNDDPLDEQVALDPDDNLPWPDVVRIRTWWRGNSHRFPSGVRLLLGQPRSAPWLKQVLAIGAQRERISAALELAILDPRSTLTEVRAPAWRQRTAAGA